MTKRLDFRLWLTLERKLQQRLRTDWEAASAPVLQAITDACAAKDWDKARSFVPSLDLVQVGEKNYDWIKYFLRAFAVLGAGQIDARKPSFVSTINFDETLQTAAKNTLQYLEHTGTAQLQAEIYQKIAEDEAKSKVFKREYQHGSTEIPLTGPVADRIEALRAEIAESDLAGHRKDVGGNHITLAYGLDDEDEETTDALREYLRGQEPFEVMLGETIAFPESAHSEGTRPIVVQVTSPELHALEEGAREVGPFEASDFDSYQPHVTLAYVRPDASQKYVGRSVGVPAPVTGVTLRHQSGVSEFVPFGSTQKKEKGKGGGNPYKDEEGKFTSKEKDADGKVTGIQHKNGVWSDEDGRPLPEGLQKRLKAVGTPPAWTNVELSIDPEAELQATGIDIKGKKQYRYSAAHTSAAKKDKYARLHEFQKKLPSVRTKLVEKMKTSPTDTYAVMRLIERTGIRPGNEGDTGADVRAFGATTLEGQHISVHGNQITLNFIGKSGKPNHRQFTDPHLAAYLKRKKFKPGEQVFPEASDSKVRRAMKEVGAEGFKLKDFRTYHGTAVALKTIKSLPEPKNAAEYKALVKKVAEDVSDFLNNTPAVALESYINPLVFTRVPFHSDPAKKSEGDYPDMDEFDALIQEYIDTTSFDDDHELVQKENPYHDKLGKFTRKELDERAPHITPTGKVLETSARGIEWLTRFREAPTKGPGSRHEPIHVGDNIKKAARLIGQGMHVTLNQPQQVATLVEKIRKESKYALAMGIEIPKFNLGAISVKGTNLFALENLGVPRVHMPQLKGVPAEGTKAWARRAEEHKAKGTTPGQMDKVDLLEDFLADMKRKGVTSEKTEMRADHMRATQSELDGHRIGQSIRKNKKNPERDKGYVIVTRDGYILDGHHKWGAQIVQEMEKGGIAPMIKVVKLDIDIGTALSLARDFQEEWGVKSKTVKGEFILFEEDEVALKAEKPSFLTEHVRFDNTGDEKLQLISSLQSSRLATWGFTAEAEFRGITHYRLTAVLDGRTSKFCRAINGKVFRVEDARTKVVEALNVQDPNDLRVVQPWPLQTNEAVAKYAKMTSDKLTELGLHIPPFHPRCRTICIGVDAPKPLVVMPLPEQTPQTVTAELLKLLGAGGSPKQVDLWNGYVGADPLELLGNLSGLSPTAILGGGIQRPAVSFLTDNMVGMKARGILDHVQYSVGTIIDPFTGRYYLTEAAFKAGDPKVAQAWVRRLLRALLDNGVLLGASSLVVASAVGEAYEYAQLGYLPSPASWQTIRLAALESIEAGDLKSVFAALTPEQRLLVDALLNDVNETALGVLADLQIEVEGKTIGQWILQHVGGEFLLDLTDSTTVAQAQALLRTNVKGGQP